MIGSLCCFELKAKEQPAVVPKELVAVETAQEKEYEIILYNDDVNTFTHVIETLIKVCQHSPQQAEQCAVLVHYTGQCAVKTGSYADLEPRCTALLDADLSAEII